MKEGFDVAHASAEAMQIASRKKMVFDWDVSETCEKKLMFRDGT